MTNPIYIIGNNTLAYYLGAQIQSSGHNVILLTDKHSSVLVAPVEELGIVNTETENTQ